MTTMPPTAFPPTRWKAHLALLPILCFGILLGGTLGLLAGPLPSEESRSCRWAALDRTLASLSASFCSDGPRRHGAEIRMLGEMVRSHRRSLERDVRPQGTSGTLGSQAERLRYAWEILHLVSVDFQLRQSFGKTLSRPVPEVEQIQGSFRSDRQRLFSELIRPEFLFRLREVTEDEEIPVAPASLAEHLEAFPVAEYRRLIGGSVLAKVDLLELQCLYAVRRALLTDPGTYEQERLEAMIEEGFLALEGRPGGKDTLRMALRWLRRNPRNDRAQRILAIPSVRAATVAGPDPSLLAFLRAAFRVKRTSPGGAEIDPLIDCRRLINLRDWPGALEKKPEAPWLVYGDQPWQDWASAARFVARDADQQPITVGLLKQVHRLATAHHYFHGFEIRRIQHAMKTGSLSESRGQDLLRMISEEGRPVRFSGIDHATLRGRFRQHPLDRFVHNGEWVDEAGQRFLTRFELERLKGNPYWNAGSKPIREIAPGLFRGEFLYPDARGIGRQVRQVLRRANSRLARAGTDLEVVRIVADLNQRLLAIHPFVDGNGRTIRLLGDLILQRKGLPPPVFLPDNELFLTVDQFVRRYVTGMKQWVDLQKRPFGVFGKERRNRVEYPPCNR